MLLLFFSFSRQRAMWEKLLRDPGLVWRPPGSDHADRSDECSSEQLVAFYYYSIINIVVS